MGTKVEEEHSYCTVKVSTEDWGSMSFLEVGIQLHVYTESQFKKTQSEHWPPWGPEIIQ
jgi:hypothetical protein